MTLLLPIAAGLDFSLPMSTPAMAMVFGTGYLRPADSVIPGIVLSILGLGVLMLVAWGVWPLFGLPLVGG
jgi:sodium-dependent dicarboxylate transporter 2/3/5